ncbi:MAG: hypothetical protein ACPG5P_02065, partial [Saprospiraceae bacterium]
MKKYTTWSIIILAIVATLYQWIFHLPKNDTLLYDVPKVAEIGFFETPNLYLLVNLLTLLFPF